MDPSQDLKNVDMSGAARGVWLVKVPKYLSESWKKAQGDDVGKLRITKPKFSGGKPEVIFTLNDQLAVKAPGEKSQVPKDHKFVLTGMANQTLGLLTQDTPGTAADGEQAESIYSEPGRLAIQGKVIQRAECRPIGDANYMQLKRDDFEAMNKPTRQVIQLNSAVVSYKPKTYQAADIEARNKRKPEMKNSRMDKDRVMDLLFSAFEKHQYYNVKDLVRITSQPITYLKEILKEICVYNMKAPHKNMWELKPEFRHYKGADGASTSMDT